MGPPVLGQPDLEQLVAAAAAGDEPAWQALWTAVEPQLTRLVGRSSFLARLGEREDDRRNILVDVMARLRDDRFHRLHLYLAARRENPQLTFMTWLRVVAKRVGIDYMRGHPDYVDKRRNANPGSAPGAWIDPGTLPPASQLPGGRPPVTSRGTANELLRHAAAVLPDAQRQALELWVQNDTYAEIARSLALETPALAERLVRAAIERLRRHFRDGDGGPTR